MKKIIISLISLFSLTGCGFIYDGDSDVAIKNILTLVNYIEKNEEEKIKDLFAPVIREEVSDLDSQIKTLCESYDGEYKSIVGNGLGVYGPINYGKKIKYFEIFKDIFTSSNSYHFSILWYIEDDYDANNIGIWSLYVEDFTGDTPQTKIESWENGITLR